MTRAELLEKVRSVVKNPPPMSLRPALAAYERGEANSIFLRWEDFRNQGGAGVLTVKRGDNFDFNDGELGLEVFLREEA